MPQKPHMHDFSMLVRYKKGLMEVFNRIHELQSDPLGKRLLALELQEKLLKRIWRAEYLIRKTRIANKEIKATLSKQGNGRQESNALKKCYIAGETKIDQQKTLLCLLRSVGDAIAFIYGDRWDLKQLAMKEGPGFITGKRGTRFERAILRRSYALGATVVMNDLTHTLRHGDITVFRPDLWPGGGSPFLLVEAKSGRGGSRDRAKRQQTAIEEIGKYLSTDNRAVEGGTFERISVARSPEYHFDTINKLALKLPHCGVCIDEVERGLHYILVDCACETSKYESAIKIYFDKTSQNYILSVNDMKSIHMGYYPFPLSLSNPETLFRFYNGEFVMFVSVNIDHVNAALAPSGLRIEVTRNEKMPWRVFPVRKTASIEEGEYFVGFHPLGRLGAEFIRLDWLIENIVIGQFYEARQRLCSQ